MKSWPPRGFRNCTKALLNLEDVAYSFEIEELLEALAEGDWRALARLLTRVENNDPTAVPVVSELYRKGTASVIGVTGPPGVGKSTLVDRLVAEARRDGVGPVAVLTIDPSSPLTGGALLGDRIRMQSNAADRGVYIRSMATRGSLGGLASAAPRAIAVLSGFGFEEVVVETVGVGQAEVDVAATASTTVVVLPPTFGDDVQAAKAGLLEIGDVFVVNQADLPGADQAVRRLRDMLSFGPPRDWDPPIVATVAIDAEGITDLRSMIVEHARYAVGRLGSETTARSLLASALRLELPNTAQALLSSEKAAGLVTDIASRAIDPWSAAKLLAAHSG